MSRLDAIEERYSDNTLNLALDTIAKKKQALVFCNTKRGAASQAERIAVKVKTSSERLDRISGQVLKAVSSPTKQCKRLALCCKKGVAFHHAGLNARQRHLIEEQFRSGEIKIICSTPTLAMGMDLPAYRTIVRDLKRFTPGKSWGMADIPVLEYEQMAGRAGRPGKEEVGQAICVAQNQGHKEQIIEKYLLGDPEEIYSKLAVEPVLRMYVLSLIATGYVHDQESLYGFFDGSFYAHQYEDLEKLHKTLEKMVGLLKRWEFIEAAAAEKEDFVVADDLAVGSLKATRLGERVAQLYLDPFTAHHLLSSLENGKQRKLTLKEFPLLHLLSTTLEIRPAFSVRKGEMDEVDSLLVEMEDDLFVKSPDVFSYEYEEFLKTIKTAQVMQAWVSEAGEDLLLERFNVSPGELQMKRSIGDWLLYSLVELCKLKGWQGLISELEKMRIRLDHGAKEDILALLRLKGIGRIRARKLYNNRIKSLGDIKKVEFSSLRELLGPKMAQSVKEQVGVKVAPEDLRVKPRKRKGQIALGDFR